MKITRENLENQTVIIRVTVEEADYNPAVDKALKEYKRKANIPGFRPGMVPMGVINKMYRKSVVAEEAYKKASDECFAYVEKENIKFVGDLLPSDLQEQLDFENETSFEFVFELGLAPEIKLDLSSADEVKKYEIKIDKGMREGYRSNFLKRFGKLVDVDAVENDEALNITLDQESMKIEDAYISLISMSEEERAMFKGKKVGDRMDVDINELYKNPEQRAAILGVKEEELETIDPKFTLEITKIRKFAEPEINEEFFKMAFPEGNITNEKEFAAHIDAQIALELSRETGHMFNLDLQNMLIKKANLTLPEEFLKKWLFTINEGKYSLEEIENDFDKFLDMMRWNLIRKHYIDEFKIEVTPEESLAEAKGTARQQFAYYGMGEVADDMLENYAKSLLDNKDESRKIYETLFERKVFEAVMPLITVTDSKISAEDFGKLVQAVQQNM